MRIAEAARRSTLRSDTSEFYLRIFDSWSCCVRIKKLAGAGDDGPTWQTSGPILPPLEGVLLRSEKCATRYAVSERFRTRYPGLNH